MRAIKPDFHAINFSGIGVLVANLCSVRQVKKLLLLSDDRVVKVGINQSEKAFYVNRKVF